MTYKTQYATREFVNRKTVVFTFLQCQCADRDQMTIVLMGVCFVDMILKNNTDFDILKKNNIF